MKLSRYAQSRKKHLWLGRNKEYLVIKSYPRSIKSVVCNEFGIYYKEESYSHLMPMTRPGYYTAAVASAFPFAAVAVVVVEDVFA